MAEAEDQTMPKWHRLLGDERESFQDRCVEMYQDQELSIREIVATTGRSYGAVHKVLVEAGIKMRPRGNRSRG